VGRASATLDKNWIEKRGENSGFIDDFVIFPEHKHDADLLLKCCLSWLKEKGMEQVMVRGSSIIPAIEVEGYKQFPAFGHPHNPPWYVDIFLQNGFVPTKQWLGFRYKIPQIPPSEAKKFEQLCQGSGIKIRWLTRESRELQHLYHETNITQFGWNPQLEASPSRFKALINHLLFRLLKMRTFVGIDANGKMVFYGSYLPDFNEALNGLNIDWSRKSLSNIYPLLKLPFVIRRTKRTLGAGIGMVEEMRGKGYMKNVLTWGLDLMRKDGYEELEGEFLSDNLPPAHIVKNIVKNADNKVGGSTTLMKYVTLTYNLKGD
jgi:hypothetical protein